MKLKLSVMASLLLCLAALAPASLKIAVSIPPETQSTPFTGRIVVFLSPKLPEPRLRPDMLVPDPVLSAPFTNVAPGQTMLLNGANATSFPKALTDIAPGDYVIQAVADLNLGGRQVGTSPGNLFSPAQKITLNAGETLSINLNLTERVPERKFTDTDAIKELAVASKSLSEFYGRPTAIRGAVILPEAYLKEPERRFPVLIDIPGFGGDHYMFSGRNSHRGTLINGEPFILVIPNPECPTGHHVFADSDNNGPWGTAFVEEFLPALDARFRTISDARARFLSGHSSGGWSSLWLQISHPDTFGGVWSTAPDSIDFRDVCGINIYAPQANAFTDPNGAPRPLVRMDNVPTHTFQLLSDMERPLRGEQLSSLEAVFSPRGPNGQPMPLWNRDTGAIDPKVAEAWRRYDIGHILRTNWPTLAPKLAGKIHITAGQSDNFYLEGAVKLVQSDLKLLESDALIEVIPGDHFSFGTQEFFARVDKMIAAKFRAFRASASSPLTQKPIGMQ